MSFAKEAVKAVLTGFFRLFSRQGAIIFESVPDFADNTYEVFLELVKRDYGKRYKMVWSCTDDQVLPDSFGKIYYIHPMKKGIKDRLRNAYYMSNAKCMICGNRFLLPWRKDQVAFFLAHGTPIKAVHSYYNMPESIHYCLATSPELEGITAYQFNVDPKKMFSLGYPRNDILLRPACPVKQILGTQCKKVMVWYPTFRQHSQRSNISCGRAMPIIHDTQAAQELNQWAKDMDVLIVMKPHFAQDISYIKDLGLSNIRIINDDFFREHDTNSYSFVAGCDALLTDYSSVYFDFTLCDKPVGLIWEDIEEYRANPGFSIDWDVYGKGGVIIYTLEHFKQFIQEVAMDLDSRKVERNALCDRVNFARDDKNTQRVTDFIVEKAGL